MKKAFTILLVLLMIIFCVACGGNSDDVEADTSKDTNTGTVITKYTITWLDEDGNKLSSDEIAEGEIPSYSYEKADTAEWDYTVEGWSIQANGEILESIPATNGNATYYAVVSKVKQKYTVKFNSNGGSDVDSQTVEYGALATLPEEPTYEGHKFIDWCTDLEGNNSVDFNSKITGDTEFFAIWNKIVDIKALLETLLSGYELSPYSYIPESLRPDFSANLVKNNEIISDYTNDFVSIADVTYGFGEQYHMVLENLEQSQTFFNILTVVESLSASSISAFNNYFDKNPASTAHHSFESGIYNVTIDFDGETISYILDYTQELPLIGVQAIQIALSMDAQTSEKTVRIQLGDANALTYEISESSYKFAIKYAGIRRAMFFIEKDDNGNVNGSIYEFLTYESYETASCAQFYITDEYASVVGNKASGLIGFTGYICELYDVETGKLLGYEVQETLSAISYDTLWFNLSDIDGISSIKYQEAKDKIPSKIFVNGSSTEWANKKALLSRRFDIEFRTQFVYSYNALEGKYTEHQISVPMIFVQEKYYDTFIDDVEATNDITIEVLILNEDLEQILIDYDELIPVFIENKDNVTVDIILQYIGEKIVF